MWTVYRLHRMCLTQEDLGYEMLNIMHRESTQDPPDFAMSPTCEEGVAALSFLRASPPTLPLPSLGPPPVITTDQPHELISKLTTTIKSNSSNSPLSEEHLFSIAKSEYYISQGLSFKFDGDHEKLAPWIKKFKALRANALWRDASYLKHEDKRYDILTEFTKIKEDIIKAQATVRWTLKNQTKSLKPNEPTLFYSRILGKVVIASITDDFYTTLQNYAGDELASDGPMLLWLILTHFHTSTVTYQDKLKQQVRTRTLAGDHKDDVESYLVWLRHTIDVLNTTSQADQHSDLLNPIFTQLLTTKSTRLRRIIEDWHLEYHSEEHVYTPASLVESADKKCKALHQSNQLYTTSDTDIIALEATLRQHQGGGRQQGGGNKHRGNPRPPKPAWYNSPPAVPTQTHKFDDRVWHWCPKCGDQGKWVCTHSADTHQNNYIKKRKNDQSHPSPRQTSPPAAPTAAAANIAVPLSAAEIAKIVADQVSAQFQAHMATYQMSRQTPHQASNRTTPMDITDWYLCNIRSHLVFVCFYFVVIHHYVTHLTT